MKAINLVGFCFILSPLIVAFILSCRGLGLKAALLVWLSTAAITFIVCLGIYLIKI